MREQLITQNAYIIDTSIRQRTGLLLPHHHVPELPEDEIGDLYRIPLRVRELAAHAANLFGRDWPLEFTALPNGTVVRVNNLWLDCSVSSKSVTHQVHHFFFLSTIFFSKKIVKGKKKR